MKGSTNGIIHRVRRLLRHAEPATDAELLARFIADRDAEAFALIVRRHGPMVHGVCRRVLRNAADADDAFQATFLLLARRARSLRHQRLVGNWLYGVAYRTALEARRAAAVRRARERRAAEMKTQPPATDEPSPDLREVLDRELAALPDVYRAAVVLCDLEGLSRKDAAERLGWAEGTLSGRLFRARSLLAARLARLGLAVPAAGVGLVASASAAVPPALAESTIRIGVLVAAGEAAAVVAAPAAALMEGVMKAMLLTKLKTMATVVVVGCAVLTTAVAGWQANAVGASAATLVEGQNEPARRAAQRDPDKDRIAQLERERDELLKIVRDLKERLQKLEADRDGNLRGRMPGEAESQREEAATRLRRLDEERARLERERARGARNANPRIVDGGPPAELAEKLRKLEEEFAKQGQGSEKARAAIKDLAEKLKAEQLKGLALDAEKFAKLKDRIPAEALDKLKSLQLDAEKLAKLKELGESDLADKLKAIELGYDTGAKLKARIKESSGDRVKELEDRVKTMEADIKKLLQELERQRRIK
jgi:RNA polymerase sigma factor (sigma-70 family)